MGLFHRLSGSITASEIPIHAFNSALRLWANGSSLVDRAAIINQLNLESTPRPGEATSDVDDLDALQAAYQAAGNAAARLQYLQVVQDACILVASDFFSEAQWKNEVGI